MALANINTADFIEGTGVTQDGNVISVAGGGGGGGTWGSITGTLSSQTDLQAELTRIENLIGNSELGTGL
jgi:hypothetical protein